MLLRSFMFLPAYNKKYIEKALESEADAIILDLEDSVPYDKRSEARNNIKEYCCRGELKKKPTFIRINPIGSKDFVDDISEMVMGDIIGFMPSKVESAEDIIFLDKLLSFFEIKNKMKDGSMKIAPLIETTKALSNINQIANASKRLVALCFGGEDYLNDLGSIYTYQASALCVPRALIANAARAAGLLPIDTPYIDISDVEGFEKAEHEAYENGYAGCLVLNPKQIAAANRAFMPEQEKIDYSRRVLSAISAAESSDSKSIAMVDGGMVGPPMRKRAQSVIEYIKLVENDKCSS